MATTVKITIRKPDGEASPTAVFDPDPAKVQVGNQIFWSNQDTVAHWPGLLKDDGSIDEKFFVRNQIAPGSGSAIWAAASAGRTYPYACKLHPDEKGTIEVL